MTRILDGHSGRGSRKLLNAELSRLTDGFGQTRWVTRCQKFAAQSHSLQLLWLDSWPSLAECYVTTFFQARRVVIFQLPPLRMNMDLCIIVLGKPFFVSSSPDAACVRRFFYFRTMEA